MTLIRGVWIVICIFTLLLAAYVALWILKPDAAPVAPNDSSTYTAAPATVEALPAQTSEPSATEIPTIDSAPIPTELPIPKNGDRRGCPLPNGTVDKGDPNCTKRQAETAYRAHYAGNPAFECNDGRNDGLGAKDLKKFVPCINSSFRLEVPEKGMFTLFQSTSEVNKIKLHDSKPGVTNPRSKGLDWIVWKQPSGRGFNICVKHDADLEYFGMYARSGATGAWERTANCAWFEKNTYYQVVVFWDDPAKPAGDAPLPPFFNWKTVAKH
jgi:hypothetical protein